MVTLVPGSSRPCLAIGPQLSQVREGADTSDVIKAGDEAITHHYTGKRGGRHHMVDTADGVRAIVTAIEKRRAKAYVPPWPYAAVAPVIRYAPPSVVRRLL